MATETTPLKRAAGGVFSCDVAFRIRVLTSIASLGEGYDLGVFNAALVPMQRDLELNEWELGVAMASAIVFVALSSLLSGSVIDTIGRKCSLGIACFALFVGNLVCAFAVGFVTLLVGRIILGCGIGLGISTVTVLLAEVAPAHTRGFYVALEELFLVIGILLGFLAGAVLLGFENDWRIMVGIGALPSTIVLVCLLTPYFPESPRYLQAVGRTDEARAVLLELLHGDEREADQVFAQWKVEALRNVSTGSWWTVACAFCRSHRKRSLAAFGPFVFQMLGGVPIVTFYSTLVLKAYGMSTVNAIRATLFLGIVRAVFVFISTFFLLDGWGRRPSLLTSAAGCAVAMGVTALACYMRWSAYAVVAGLCLFTMAFSVGLGPVPYAYAAEVFDTETRGKGVSVGIFFSRVVSATYTTVIPVVLGLGLLEVACIYLAVVNVFVVAYIFVFCPETKGIALEQMHEVFATPPQSPRGSNDAPP